MEKKIPKAVLVNIHVKENVSLLSTEAQSPNYRGFLNLGAIILIVANFRLIIENILKYGLLLNDPLELARDYLSFACIFTYLLNLIPILIIYYTETKLAQSISSSSVRIIHTIVQIYLLTLPIVSIYHFRVHYVPASVLLGLTLMIAMKLYSFADVMYDVREVYKTKEYLNFPKDVSEVIQKYPNVVNFNHFVYFLFTPTFCFQFSYPRSQSIRKIWLLKRVVEFIISLSLMLIIIQQYITPLIKNTIPIIQQENINYILLLERHLKLSLPNLYL